MVNVPNIPRVASGIMPRLQLNDQIMLVEGSNLKASLKKKKAEVRFYCILGGLPLLILLRIALCFSVFPSFDHGDYFVSPKCFRMFFFISCSVECSVFSFGVDILKGKKSHNSFNEHACQGGS